MHTDYDYIDDYGTVMWLSCLSEPGDTPAYYDF